MSLPLPSTNFEPQLANNNKYNKNVKMLTVRIGIRIRAVNKLYKYNYITDKLHIFYRLDIKITK